MMINWNFNYLRKIKHDPDLNGPFNDMMKYWALPFLPFYRCYWHLHSNMDLGYFLFALVLLRFFGHVYRLVIPLIECCFFSLFCSNFDQKIVEMESSNESSSSRSNLSRFSQINPTRFNRGFTHLRDSRRIQRHFKPMSNDSTDIRISASFFRVTKKNNGKKGNECSETEVLALEFET